MGDTAAQDTAYNMKVLKSILSYLRLNSTVRFPFFRTCNDNICSQRSAGERLRDPLKIGKRFSSCHCNKVSNTAQCYKRPLVTTVDSILVLSEEVCDREENEPFEAISAHFYCRPPNISPVLCQQM